MTTGQRNAWRRRGVRVIAAGAILALVSVLSACDKASSEGFDYLRVTVDGQETLAITKKGAAVRGVVVYFHGASADEFTMSTDQPHKSLTTPLVSAGFAVVSSRAGGNAFGNPSSQQNYRALAEMALDHYHVQNVFFLAESLGAVAALNLMASAQTIRIRGIAAINPAVDLANAPQSYAPYVAESFPYRPMLALTNPMGFAPAAFADKKFRFYVSPADEVVPADANALAFQQRFGTVADISVVGCSGRHGDPSCMQGDDVLKWFSSLERRTES